MNRHAQVFRNYVRNVTGTSADHFLFWMIGNLRMRSDVMKIDKIKLIALIGIVTSIVFVSGCVDVKDSIGHNSNKQLCNKYGYDTMNKSFDIGVEGGYCLSYICSGIYDYCYKINITGEYEKRGVCYSSELNRSYWCD